MDDSFQDSDDESSKSKGRSNSTRWRRKKRRLDEESEFAEIIGSFARNQPVALQQGEDTLGVDELSEAPIQSSPHQEEILDQSIDQGQDTLGAERPAQFSAVRTSCSHQESNLEQLLQQDGEGPTGPCSSDSSRLPRDFVDTFLQQEDNFDAWDSDSSSCLEANFSFEEHDVAEDEASGGEGSDADGDYRRPIQIVNSSPEVSSDEEDENDDEDGENITFSEALDIPLDFNTYSTMKESLIMDLALSVRHHLTYEALIQLFETKNTLLGKKYFPTSKKELWRVIGRKNSGIISHVYCGKCGAYVNKKRLLPEQTACPTPTCEEIITTSTAKYFVTISLRKQLQTFLNTPGAAKLLSYRDNRPQNSSTIDDILDGKEYKRLQAGVMNSNDFTMTLNVDACKMTKSSKLKLTPVFLRVNEIHPQQRQKFMCLAALFVDFKEPNTNSYFTAIVPLLNALSNRGITWNRNGAIVTSRFFTICFCVDGKARAQLLNMNPHSGKYGCTYCTINGVRIANTMRYPAKSDPPYEDRTHEGMISDMTQAYNEQTNVRGHKGVTVMSLLKHLDLVSGSAADDLHNLYECAVPTHINLILKSTPRLDKNMGYDAMCAIIDERLKKIKTPDSVSRKPGTTSILNRDSYKGNEWKNLILFYAVLCLQNLVDPKYIYPLELLSHFAFLLSQDKISEENLVRAERYIQEYLSLFEKYYGITRTRLNMHALVHACNSVRNLGPYWVYSTFNFESWNAKILKHVTSPKGILLQVVLRHLIQMKLEMSTLDDPGISDTVRTQLKKILDKKKRRVRAVQFSEHCHLLGNSSARQITAAELEVLSHENFLTTEVEVLNKVIIDSVEYEPANKKVASKSNNSMLYSHQDTFCQIVDIVMFQHNDGTKISGMFVKEFDVAPRPFQHASHITELCRSSLPHFLQCHQVKAPVVTVPLLGKTYVIPLPNNYDID